MLPDGMGPAYLKPGDTLRLAIFASTDTNFEIEHQAHFSVHRVDSDFGFSADLSADIVVPRVGWTEIRGARRTSGSAGLFVKGNCFDVPNGIFITPVTGYYYVSANIRLDGAGGAYFRVALKVRRSELVGLAQLCREPPASLPLGLGLFAQANTESAVEKNGMAAIRSMCAGPCRQGRNLSLRWLPLAKALI